MPNENLSPVRPRSVPALPIGNGIAKGGPSGGTRVTVCSITRHGLKILPAAAYARAVAPLIEALRDHGMLPADNVEVRLIQSKADDSYTQGTTVEITQR